MKSFQCTCFLVALVLGMLFAPRVSGQFMPVVYDHVYGDENQFTVGTADFQSGDVVLSGTSDGGTVITWLDRNGNSRFAKRFGSTEFARINKIIPLAEDRVLVVGSRTVGERDRDRATGRAVVFDNDGGIVRELNVGEEGTDIVDGRFIANGNLILTGSAPVVGGGRSAVVMKVSSEGRVLYNYKAATGEACYWFDIVGSATEYVNAAFTSVDREGSSVVRLDENGKPFYITTLPDPTFRIEKMVSSVEGDVYVVGQGQQIGGAVIKIRPEGDIVFQKQIVPATGSTRFDKLIVYPTGELLVGGNDNQNAYFALLRSDGTELSSNVDRGVVAGIVNDPATGECVISLYGPGEQGKVIKLSKEGRRLYEKFAAANYTALRIDLNGDLLMAAPQTGRLTMLSNRGEMLFDRFVEENNPQRFAGVFLPANGEVFFAGEDSRVAKLAHGVYVADIEVNKPIDGYTTALFTVTLSGYSYTPQGEPIPVTVAYRTTPITATEGVNYDPVAGTLSFIPSVDGSDRYLNKFTVEVPVKANDLLEGERDFRLDLSEINNSYLIRSSSLAAIEDQQAIVRTIATTPGLEGQTDVTYTLGIFKTNGTPLVNATRADVVIDGAYGRGTADPLDFDMGRMPRLVIADGQHSGQFNVVTRDDARYESVKTVVIDFSRVHAMSDTHVSFGSNVLSCTGEMHDQAAMVAIETLGDHTRLNNQVSGFFKVSLLRAKDGVLLTNHSGADVVLTAEVAGSGAEQGRDYVLTNLHDLRIWGDDRSSAVNLNGMVLYSPDPAAKSVSVTLTGVSAGERAGTIGICTERNTDSFTIVNK